MKRTIFILSLLATVLCLTISAHAEPQKLQFSFPVAFEPISGVGFVMSTTGTRTVYPIEISSKDGITLASFSIEKKELPADSLASVAVFSSEGEIEISKTQSVQRLSFPKLPRCEHKDSVVLDAQNQIGVLQSLVSIRTARRDNARQKVEQLLTPSLLERLTKLEKGFGLTSEPALSASLPALALRDRLHRLLQAVKNYRSSAKK